MYDSSSAKQQQNVNYQKFVRKRKKKLILMFIFFLMCGKCVREYVLW